MPTILSLPYIHTISTGFSSNESQSAVPKPDFTVYDFKSKMTVSS